MRFIASNIDTDRHERKRIYITCTQSQCILLTAPSSCASDTIHIVVLRLCSININRGRQRLMVAYLTSKIPVLWSDFQSISLNVYPNMAFPQSYNLLCYYFTTVGSYFVLPSSAGLDELNNNGTDPLRKVNIFRINLPLSCDIIPGHCKPVVTVPILVRNRRATIMKLFHPTALG